MQVSRCIHHSVRQRFAPFSTYGCHNAAASDRYKIIWNFFRQQIPAADSTKKSPRPGLTFSHANALRPHYTLLYEKSCWNVRFYHATPRLREKRQDRPESVNGPETPEINRKTSQPVRQNVAKSDEHSRYQNIENYSRFFRRLAMTLPPMQRPTRDDFLRVATGFWQRLRIRFKWFTIRAFRKFNADEISAFFSWFIMSQAVWILIGTTTFFSVIFAIVNSLRLQEYVARAISNYLTSETGITIIFESAIVPKWKDSRIAFKNVYISRRPQSSPPPPPQQLDPNAAHRAASRYDIHNHPAYHGLEDEQTLPVVESDEDTNYVFFDLNVDSIDVTFSLWRWLDGKGLVEDAVVKGVRGVLDRRHIHYDPDKPLDPADFRHPSRPGDFQLESLQVEDLLISIYQPDGFRPFTFSIFRADINTFRKRWLFYDFLSAESVVGQFDNCLFSLHKPQSIGKTMEQEIKDGHWSRMARFRIDGVNIDHLKRATTMEGPVSWITSGKFDAVLDIRFPQTEQTDITALLGELAEVITNTATAQAARLVDRIPGQRELARPAISPPEDVQEDEVELPNSEAPRVVSVDIDLRFRDVKATVPIFTRDLSYVNNALIRPIVAFINANKTLVPIRCRVVKELSEFDGAWTMWETGLMDEISIKLYEALAYHVMQANFNRRVKTVGVWSLQKTITAALQALHTIMQPMSVYLPRLREGEPLVEWGNMPM